MQVIILSFVRWLLFYYFFLTAAAIYSFSLCIGGCGNSIVSSRFSFSYRNFLFGPIEYSLSTVIGHEYFHLDKCDGMWQLVSVALHRLLASHFIVILRLTHLHSLSIAATQWNTMKMHSRHRSANMRNCDHAERAQSHRCGSESTIELLSMDNNCSLTVRKIGYVETKAPLAHRERECVSFERLHKKNGEFVGVTWTNPCITWDNLCSSVTPSTEFTAVREALGMAFRVRRSVSTFDRLLSRLSPTSFIKHHTLTNVRVTCVTHFLCARSQHFSRCDAIAVKNKTECAFAVQAKHFPN